MTTALDIIKQAYRESNLIAIGTDPTEAEQTEALPRLNTIVSSVLGAEVGEQLNDWPVGTVGIENAEGWTSNQWKYLPANIRVIVNGATAQTLNLPPMPSDGARVAVVDVRGTLAAQPITLNGNGRLIEGATSVVLSTNNLARSWLYRADLGKWMRVEALSLGSEMPYPIDFDDVFISMLAMRLNPRYGRSVDQQTVATYDRAVRRLKGRYRQRTVIPADPAVLFMSVQAGRGWQGNRFVFGNINWPYGVVQ